MPAVIGLINGHDGILFQAYAAHVVQHPAMIDVPVGRARPAHGAAEGDREGRPAAGRGPLEGEVRRALASIPLDRLREAGLLAALTRLVDVNGSPGPEPADGESASAAEIDEMDVDDLVRMTFEEA